MSDLAAADDLRHRAPPGGRMRDSLFWQVTLPEEGLGVQAYLYLTHKGYAGFNVCVWGRDMAEPVVDLAQGQVGDDIDFDDFVLSGLTLRQPSPLQTCQMRYRGARVSLDYDFEGLHRAFSYRENPDGVPPWFAENRFEQTGRVKGSITVDGRVVALDRIGHRDHSWGVRDWGMPQHWKWFVAYTPDGARVVNGWIWIARGEWGFAGYVVSDGEMWPVSTIAQRATYDETMGQQTLKATLFGAEGQALSLELTRFGLVRLPSNDKLGTVIMEAACEAVLDGRPGAGQFETHWAQSYLAHLTADPA